ncbi:MAG: Extracellular solute-binding protein family 1 [Candidatus Roizmanbacteria bacterium GW2011_GWC2_37_13]|uniref:Extracellular solute-binding protein family 1 n=1 Tax=Candidatus Roizmanbacteria bacterium GW2011_GWC2_37_13 TaxID=1618486 RepID=A0A0G0IR01_9BACT|nr:MAG: Extracellular solute-binding protein family 1 [Candidatus Roizmanbacteria bacterium GW2011_GWC1_37_12]KKQ26584.1 MAG: Extracellular solute-binding protein family 1 [Candidatus Roizmanbacteria bacterium GW2011_GWC2_37_13]
MDDNNEIPEINQPTFETVPVETSPKIEETPEEVVNPESLQPPPSDLPPPVYQENKNQYFLIIGGAIVFFIFLILVIRAIFSGGGGKKEISLTYWGLWEDKEIVQPLIEQYQQKNPNVKINYQKMSPQSYREKLVVRSKNNQGPDLFRFHNTWVPEIKEVLAPMPSSIMNNAEFEKTFYKVHQKDLKVGNYYYGLPLEIDGLVLIYNESLFKKAGVSIVPSTWDEITDIVPRLTVKDTQGNLITSGIAMGTTANIEHFSDIFGLLLVQNGGSLDKLDQAEAAGALEIYRKFSEAPQGYWTDEMPNSINAFIQEKVAMTIVPSWQALTIKAANPEITIKIVPVPVVPGASMVSIASYWVEGVSRFSKNQIEAWKFLRYLTEKENMTKLYEIQSRLRPYGEPYSRVDLASLLAQNQYLGAVIKQADNFVSLPLISRTYDNGLNDEIIKYLENAINSTAQGVSYSEALKTAKQGVTQVFTKYNISY